MRNFSAIPIRASMRPRHKAAENGGGGQPDMARSVASMRPRHKAAENVLVAGLAGGPTRSFNEAAA